MEWYPCMWISRDGPPTRDPPGKRSGSRAPQRKKKFHSSHDTSICSRSPTQNVKNSDGCLTLAACVRATTSLSPVLLSRTSKSAAHGIGGGGDDDDDDG